MPRTKLKCYFSYILMEWGKYEIFWEEYRKTKGLDPEHNFVSFSVTKRNYQRSESCSVVSNSSGPHGLYSQGNSRDQNTGVVSRSLLQGIFPTQGSNPGLPHCRQILYQLSHQGSPKTLEWVAYPFSSRSSLSRDWTGVSSVEGRSVPAELPGKLQPRGRGVPWHDITLKRSLLLKAGITGGAASQLL